MKIKNISLALVVFLLVSSLVVGCQPVEPVGAPARVSSVFSGGLTLLPDTTGGNLGVKSEFIGLPRLMSFGVGTGTNPVTQTIALMDDSPAAEWAPVDASVVEAVSTTVVKYGTNSYHAAFSAAATEGDGIIDAGLGAAGAWDDMESFGILAYSDTAWASGDLAFSVVDDTATVSWTLPALTELNKWTWLEVDISTGDMSSVSDVALVITSQGATNLGAFNLYVDIMYIWDSADEEALSLDIQPDGILGVVDAADGTNLAVLTDYIIHYEDGVDFLVWVSDQSAAYPTITAAY